MRAAAVPKIDAGLTENSAAPALLLEELDSVEESEEPEDEDSDEDSDWEPEDEELEALQE